MFTGDEFADGGSIITNILKQTNTKASFFLTGRFYRNPAFKNIIQELKRDRHYLGAHSDEHLLYNDWSKRDSLLVTKGEYTKDLLKNYAEMQRFGVSKQQAKYFLPPYEWYNDSIAAWTKGLNLQLINYTPGTLSHADYTTPEMKNYRSSQIIWNSIVQYESNSPSGLNGFILLLHIGTDPKRTDKFYFRLRELINWLKQKNYNLISIDELLQNS